MSLQFIEPSTTQHFSAILFGPEGIGKSVAAASAPGPILYLNADAKDGLRYARRKFAEKDIREVRVTGLQVLYDAILYVQQNGDVQTVVLDTVGKAYQAVLRDLARDDKHPTLPEYGDTGTHVERFVEALIELPVNVILVAHDMTVEVAGVEQEGTLSREQFPFVGTSKEALSKRLMQLVSVVGYCGVRHEGEQREFVAQLFEGHGRRAKDRTSALGDVRVTDLSEWAEAIRVFHASPAAEKIEKKEGKR